MLRKQRIGQKVRIRDPACDSYGLQNNSYYVLHMDVSSTLDNALVFRLELPIDIWCPTVGKEAQCLWRHAGTDFAFGTQGAQLKLLLRPREYRPSE